MLPGRQYTPADAWYLLVRHKWLIVLPWLVLSTSAVLVARLLPNEYRSESLIQVVPQRVPENLVRLTITQSINERLPAIQQQILSRTRLERIIQDFGLYQKERQTKLMEDIVASMRNNIQVNIVKGDAFRVAYSSDDARTAMKVTERLASLFVEENLRDREVLAEGANQFLDSQLDDARRRLLDHEKKLEEYRRQYSGELPSQLTGTLQAIQSMQNQMTALSESINRDRDRRLVLERQIVDLGENPEPAPSLVVTTLPGGPGDRNAASTAAQLAAAKAQLADMSLHLKADHPDVQHMKRTIAELEKKADIEALQVPVSQVDPIRTMSPAERQRLNRIRDLKIEIEAIDKQSTLKEDGQKRLQRMIADYQQRVEATPTRESDLIALNRDYDTLSKIYTTLLQKGEEAKVAANLERRQIGEQFKVLDAARLPERPFSPNRPLINGVGVGGGLLFGLAFVILLEIRDSSFRTESDVMTVLSLPVLATIPSLLTVAELKRKRRRVAIIAVATVFVVVFGGLAALWQLRMLNSLLEPFKLIF